VFDGRDITHADQTALRPLRGQIQIVFQDPYSALNPRMRVREIIAEPLRNLGWDRARIEARIAEVLEIVGLPAEYVTRYPHAFSGGQRQRIGIARALAPGPRLIVCDEAVSALDVSIQAQILNLLKDIQERFGLTMVFISHNLAVVRHVSHRVAVMYLGQVVELASEAELFANPQHPYTAALIAAVPEPDPALARDAAPLEGDLPSPIDLPPGCAFHTRCPIARPRCRSEAPAFRALAQGHDVRCHYPGEIRSKP
jgi:oligopeptide/dipeptide ABC transporter ATP-binding protein